MPRRKNESLDRKEKKEDVKENEENCCERNKGEHIHQWVTPL
jgi:hypothetical protein